MVSDKNECKFYHCPRRIIINHLEEISSMQQLEDEFRRLATNRLDTQDTVVIDFIATRPGVSSYSFNYQCILSDVQHVIDSCQLQE